VDIQKRVNEKIGIKESDTGLAAPNLWDIQSDKVSSYLFSCILLGSRAQREDETSG
jgi:hypothetical protein